MNYRWRFRCECPAGYPAYAGRDHKPLYVRVMIQSQASNWGKRGNPPPQKARYKWERVGWICLGCRAVELDPVPTSAPAE